MKKVLPLLIISIILLLGCDSAKEQDTFVAEANQTPIGFTETGDDGLVTSNDEDDWRTAPYFASKVLIDPAYPNPFSTSGNTAVVRIPFFLRFEGLAGGIQLIGFDNQIPARQVTLDFLQETTEPGGYELQFDPARLSASGNITEITGLHRVFIFDFNGRLISYGDIKIE